MIYLKWSDLVALADRVAESGTDLVSPKELKVPKLVRFVGGLARYAHNSVDTDAASTALRTVPVSGSDNWLERNLRVSVEADPKLAPASDASFDRQCYDLAAWVQAKMMQRTPELLNAPWPELEAWLRQDVRMQTERPSVVSAVLSSIKGFIRVA